MAFYTLVVQVPDEVAQDDLIAAVDGIPWARAEVTFCGPGSLVESPADEALPCCEACGCTEEGPGNERAGFMLCEGCDLIGASILTDDGEAMAHFSDERIGKVARLLSRGSGATR